MDTRIPDSEIELQNRFRKEREALVDRANQNARAACAAFRALARLGEVGLVDDEDARAWWDQHKADDERRRAMIEEHQADLDLLERQVAAKKNQIKKLLGE